MPGQDQDEESRRRIARQEAKWLRERRHADLDKDENDEFDAIPSPARDPAAAPLGTDQEAGGAISTPDGQRKYDDVRDDSGKPVKPE